METEKIITILVTYNNNSGPNQECVVQLPEYDTVELLKIEIHRHIGIPPHKQLFTGWHCVPSCDNTILKDCTTNNFANLTVSSVQVPETSVVTYNNDPEIQSTQDFKEYLTTYYPTLSPYFQNTNLCCVFAEACLVSIEKKKIFILYLHNQNDKFSTQFLDNLIKPEILSIIKNKFFILGWNIEKSEYECALCDAVESKQLETISPLIKSRKAAVLFLIPNNDTVELFSCLRTNFLPEYFNDYIMNTIEVLEEKIQQEMQYNSDSYGNADAEFMATSNFKQILSERYPSLVPLFHYDNLGNALSTACFGPLDQRKIMILFLYKENDQFAQQFLKNLEISTVACLLEDRFYLLGWEIGKLSYEHGLNDALNNHELGNVTGLIETKSSAVLFIFPVKESVTVFYCIRKKFSANEFRDNVMNSKKTLEEEIQQEKELNEISSKTSNENDFNSETYQKLMANMLGDRDYDSFEYYQHEHLKTKIGYALFGPPQTEEVYVKKQKKKIDELFKKIVEINNEFAKYLDHVQISVIYNCVEPLPGEKLAKAKKDPKYNPNTDLTPIPLFVLRKCCGSKEPCRVFIDEIGRTYLSFQQYIETNKLHPCGMVLPENGRYTIDGNDKVLLERHLSPACGIDAKILQGADIVSTAAGLISGGVALAAVIPAITVAPIVGTVAAVTGIGAGVYAIGRSIGSLIDRSRHKETLNITNSEARGAYLNILAGSLGFVGAGSNILVSELVKRGVNIGQGAAAAVNTVNVANLATSTASLANSGYDVIDQWINENQTPSMLTVIQLSSSVLFFGHAVYNFKTCATIVNEAQASTLKDIQDSLRSNRHRKTFNKLMKETIRTNQGNEVTGRAEVIKTIRNIQNKDEVLAALTRSNKSMNKYGVKFAAQGGDITMNGVKIDMASFSTLTQKDANSFLAKLPMKTEQPTSTDTKSLSRTVDPLFSSRNLSKCSADAIVYVAKILSGCNGTVKDIIINIVTKLLSAVSKEILQALDNIFPNSIFAKVMDMVMNYFSNLTDGMEKKYILWCQTRDPQYYDPLFEHIDEKTFDKTKRWLKIFQLVIGLFSNGGRQGLSETALKEILNHFHAWAAKQICDYGKKMEDIKKRECHSARKPAMVVHCPICLGFYYQRN